jgi:hypothetical protein
MIKITTEFHLPITNVFVATLHRIICACLFHKRLLRLQLPDSSNCRTENEIVLAVFQAFFISADRRNFEEKNGPEFVSATRQTLLIFRRCLNKSTLVTSRDEAKSCAI